MHQAARRSQCKSQRSIRLRGNVAQRQRIQGLGFLCHQASGRTIQGLPRLRGTGRQYLRTAAGGRRQMALRRDAGYPTWRGDAQETRGRVAESTRFRRAARSRDTPVRGSSETPRADYFDKSADGRSELCHRLGSTARWQQAHPRTDEPRNSPEGHAATTRKVSEILSAFEASAWSVSREGISASHSMSVGRGPKRFRAAPYRPHTSSQTSVL